MSLDDIKAALNQGFTLQHGADAAFLALTLYREDRGGTPDSRAAVAHSIMKRVRDPGWWGDSVMAVVFKKWQYSSLTDPHDPQLTTWPLKATDPAWAGCLTIADGVLRGTIPNPVPGADSYYDVSLKDHPPDWSTKPPATFVKQVDRLFFFNTTGRA